MEIDDTSKGVVSRLQFSINSSAAFTPVELAHFLAEIVTKWYQYRKAANLHFPYTDSTDALKHAQEVLDAVYPTV